MIYSLLGSVSSFENYWGGGGGGAPHHFHLLFCGSVYTGGALRTTVPLVCYIRNSLRYGIMLPLVHVVKILKKSWVTGKSWEKAGVKLLRDLTEKSVNFSTLVTSNIRLLLVFGEDDQ